METKEFYELVSQMRQAQKEYFKTRNKDVLVRSKKLEKRVDEEIECFKNGGKEEPSLEGGLFSIF